MEAAAVFLTFLRLGCVSFGGPAAHLSYFREEFVTRRGWLDDETLAECIAVSQILPGPGSSQTGMLIGYLRAGRLGALLAWLGFTLPSATLMTLLGAGLFSSAALAPALHGLLLVAVAVVAVALLTMRSALVRDIPRVILMVFAAAAVLLWPLPLASPAAIVLCALVAALFLRVDAPENRSLLRARGSVGTSVAIGAVFMILALAAVLYVPSSQMPQLSIAAKMFAVGSLVFGGGHVVLPLMQAQLVQDGIATPSQLISGYAAAQAMPGPLFTIAAYAGRVAYGGTAGPPGAAIATICIFAPSFFLLAAVLPFYERVRNSVYARRAIAGANAAVVGLLAAAFVTPIWTSAVHDVRDVIAASVAFVALRWWHAPPWLVVLAGVIGGAVLFRGSRPF